MVSREEEEQRRIAALKERLKRKFPEGKATTTPEKPLQGLTKAEERVDAEKEREANAEKRIAAGKEKEAEAEERVAKGTAAEAKAEGTRAKSSPRDWSGLRNALQSGLSGARAVGSKAAEIATTEIPVEPKWLAPLIIILGFFVFYLRVSTQDVTTAAFFISHFVIFPLAGYALVNKLGRKNSRYPILLPMLFFFVWFHVFGRNTEPGFLLFFLGVCALLLAIPSFFSKGQAIKPELFGFIPVIFLFLDSGLLPYLTENLNLPITSLTQGLVLYMPWWVVFGVLMLPQQFSEKYESLNFIFGLLKIGMILYVVVTLVVPTIPQIGYESVVPSAEELEEAQVRLREQLPKKENPFVSTLDCLFLKQRYNDLQKCVDRRQQESEWEYVCKNIEKHKESKEEDSPYQQCLKEQEERSKNKVLQVGGTIDRTIKIPTTAKIVFEQRRFGEEYSPEFGYPFELRVENPRKQEITAEAGCRFEGKRGTVDVPGEIRGQAATEGVQVVHFADESFSTRFICHPLGGLDGEYNLMAEVRLFNLKTVSRLERAFIGEKTPEERTQLRTEEISRSIQVKESLAPADLAFIRFDIGHSPQEIVIENRDGRNILLRANVHNFGGGKLLSVDSYQIDALFMAPSNPSCLQGSIPEAEKFKGDIPLPPCVLEYPGDLQFVEDWVKREFRAELTYDYLISQKVEINRRQAKQDGES